MKTNNLQRFSVETDVLRFLLYKGCKHYLDISHVAHCPFIWKDHYQSKDCYIFLPGCRCQPADWQCLHIFWNAGRATNRRQSLVPANSLWISQCKYFSARSPLGYTDTEQVYILEKWNIFALLNSNRASFSVTRVTWIAACAKTQHSIQKAVKDEIQAV